jgi:hypothetical protein
MHQRSDSKHLAKAIAQAFIISVFHLYLNRRKKKKIGFVKEKQKCTFGFFFFLRGDGFFSGRRWVSGRWRILTLTKKNSYPRSNDRS